MSGHKYISNTNNLFVDEDDDIADEMFLKNSRVNNGQHHNNTNPFRNDSVENQQQTMFQKKLEIEERTLGSTHRSLKLLEETEQVGMATADELAKQREQLEKTSKQLDEINSTLRFSQKHLNGLKSVFGGLKNYLSGSKNYSPRMTTTTSGNNLSETNNGSPTEPMSPEERYASHPISKLREDNDNQLLQKQQKSSQQFEQRLDENLDQMAGSLSRLRGLALDLNQEIEGQNELLDNITNKVEDADLKIGKQNKDMNKLLGNK